MVTIKEITSKKELKQFVRFPFSLYKDHPFWVPPLLMDEMKTLDKTRNPSFEFSEAAYFLAYKENKPVGRIAGIINHKANEQWNDKRTRFGWLDFTDDEEVSRALLETVETWGKNKGMTGIHGPLGFTDFDPEGMLIEGFDKMPSIVGKYNYPYYPVHIEKLGYVKSVDWVQYHFPASQPVPEKVERINRIITQKYNLRTCIFKTRKETVSYARKLFDTVNKSFAGIYGFSSLTQKQVDYYVQNFFSFIRPELVCYVLNEQDEVIGFGVNMPTLSHAFRKAKGRIFPFGWAYMLHALYRYDTIDLYINGVHPDWHNRGIHSLYYVALNNEFIRHGVKTAIATPQLESNINAVGIWDNYEKELYMRTRCYIKNYDDVMM
ncbi:MAG: hypothetical protein LBG31_00325 [Prevotellaceae bacterium]|jgi:hypothetical protein|nr:hypothetical protein [Prevotellaceae bacterium]